MTNPLEGIRVVDFSRILAGPLCTMMLGDAGAEVIKVESPEGDETRRWGPPFAAGESAYFLSINRNKQSVTLDLKTRRGREKAHALIETADVVVENYLARQHDKLQISPHWTKRINRKAVHCGIRGYDSDSPLAAEPGFDLLAQAASGLMSITGPAEGPPSKVGVALADVLTAHWAHGAILAALLERGRTGEGSVVEISLHGATVASLINVAQSFLVTGEPPSRHGNEHPSITPYQTFECADGWIAVGATSASQYRKLCAEVLGREDLLEDERFESNEARVRNRSALVAILESIFRAESSTHWIELCRTAGVPVAPVSTVDEVLARKDAPVIKGRHPSIGDLAMVRNPVRRNEQFQTQFSPPPRLGEHQKLVDDPTS